jgi:type I restriction enzyme, S subunit
MVNIQWPENQIRVGTRISMSTSLSTLKKPKPNPAWASLPLFDRSEWKRVRFGDVVENCAETCDPKEVGLERFVAMEHLEPGSLHVRSWGNVADGTTFTRRCRPGQVLFGKRRAYQRKVAVAEFEAVVSGDIYVLAPKDAQRLLPELLPFLCLSERFFQHAVGTSAGSLSPRTNWSSLASFEFDLPPLDQQRRIAEILWAVDEAHRKNLQLAEAMEIYRKVALLSTFEAIASAPTKQAREVGDVQLGRQRAPQYTTGRFSKPYLRVVNVIDGELDLRDVEEMDFDERDFARYSLKGGDILITEGDITGPKNVGRSAIYRDEIPDCCFQKTLLRFRPGELMTPEFAHAALQHAFHKGELAKIAVTTTVSHLTAERFQKFRFLVPEIDVQQRICAELAPVLQCRGAQIDKMKHSEKLAAALLQMMGS